MLFQLLGGAVFLGLLTLTWRRVRQGALRLVEGLAWSIIWVGGIVLLSQPDRVTLIAQFFGIGRGSDFILYISVIVLGGAVFLLALSLDRMRREMTRLVQELALRELPPLEDESKKL